MREHDHGYILVTDEVVEPISLLGSGILKKKT
jgi:hypothetical protein